MSNIKRMCDICKEIKEIYFIGYHNTCLECYERILNHSNDIVEINIKKHDLNTQYPIKNDSFKPKSIKDVLKSIKKFNRKHDILEYLLVISVPIFIGSALIGIINILMILMKLIY